MVADAGAGPDVNDDPGLTPLEPADEVGAARTGQRPALTSRSDHGGHGGKNSQAVLADPQDVPSSHYDQRDGRDRPRRPRSHAQAELDGRHPAVHRKILAIQQRRLHDFALTADVSPGPR